MRAFRANMKWYLFCGCLSCLRIKSWVIRLFQIIVVRVFIIVAVLRFLLKGEKHSTSIKRVYDWERKIGNQLLATWFLNMLHCAIASGWLMFVQPVDHRSEAHRSSSSLWKAHTVSACCKLLWLNDTLLLHSFPNDSNRGARFCVTNRALGKSKSQKEELPVHPVTLLWHPVN